MVDLIILGGLTLLVITAFFYKRMWFRIAVMFLLLATLWGREFSIEAYARSDAGRKGEAGEWTEQYRDGSLSIVRYCQATRVYVLGISGLIAVLFIRGLTTTKRDTKVTD